MRKDYLSWEDFRQSCSQELDSLELDNYELYAWLQAIRLTIKAHERSIAGARYKDSNCKLCTVGIMLADRSNLSCNMLCTKCPWIMVFPLEDTEEDESDVKDNRCFNRVSIDYIFFGYRQHKEAIIRLKIWEKLLENIFDYGHYSQNEELYTVNLEG